jgi:hypothetical protein
MECIHGALCPLIACQDTLGQRGPDPSSWLSVGTYQEEDGRTPMLFTSRPHYGLMRSYRYKS